ncbi:MAG: two-component regulator propeller domain-containing protein [Ferruginibacter sp.]
MRNFIQLSFLLTGLLIFSNTIAQPPGYKNFKLEKDNRQVKINVLHKNNAGYILAGTDEGLYKFDGERYLEINFDNIHYHDTVTSIYSSNKGKCWVGFKSGRIANIKNNKLVYFDPEEGTAKKRITAFIQDKEDNTWFSTAGEGIYVFTGKQLYLFNAADGLHDENVSSLMLTANGDVLAGTDGGIYICHFDKGKKRVALIGPRQGLPDYIVTSIIDAGKDIFWVGLQDKGFCLYDHSNNKISIPSAVTNWKLGQVNALLQAQQALWIATQDSGLYKYIPAVNKLEKVHDVNLDKTITGLLEDNQGNIWITSFNYGLLKTPGESMKLLQIPSQPLFEHIHVLLSDRKGNIWLNNEWNDLLRIDQSSGTAIEKKIHIDGLHERTDITSLYEDKYGNIWIGTMGKGVFILNPSDFKHRLLKEAGTHTDASILSINGNGNNIFISSLQGSMRVDLGPENKDINNPYDVKDYDNKSTGTDYIYSIFPDSKGRVWFATDGAGLTKLENNRFTYYNNKEQIKDDRIYSVTEDNNGNIWFSTASAGIYQFDGKTFKNYSISEGLSNLKISVLKKDRAGNIIIVNKKGLDILDPVSGNISYLGGNQGVSMINAEDIGAVTTDTSGNVMVSTMKGILTYSLPPNSVQKPKALIESVQLFLKNLGDDASTVFSHDENNFTFNYTGLYYSAPDKVYYKYKLEGLDTGWVITTDRSKNFPKLEPGKYTFHIQASLNKNFHNADEASYSFLIKQAFYTTWWFYLGCVLLLVAIVYLYVKRREASLKNIERMRQEKIQFQFEVLRNQVNPHFLFNSFNTLISTIEEEPKIAVEYATQLSDFFRNIVTQRDKDTISLKEEIGLLRSYSFLQQKRYGNSLQVNIELSQEQKEEYNIPPLTLQLLMENAIKHNAVSKETILTITVRVSESCLEIKNNINPKISRAEGAGMGLQNIISRYNLLTNKAVRVINDGKYFTVFLPLLK